MRTMAWLRTKKPFAVGLIALLSVASTIPLESGANAGMADEESVRDSVFTPNFIFRRKLYPPPAELNSVIEGTRKVLLQQIGSAEDAWFNVITAPQVATAAERKYLLESLRAEKFYLCREDCSACPNDAFGGCALVGEVADSVVGIGLLKQCAFSTKGCNAQARLKVSPATAVFQAVHLSLASLAYFKFHKTTQRRPAEKAAIAAAAAISNSFAMMSKIAAAAPSGVLPVEGGEYLISMGHLRQLDDYSAICGRKLLDPLRKPLPKDCTAVIDSARLKTLLASGLLDSVLPSFRCDELCRSVTQGGAKMALPEGVPFPLRFGQTWMMTLPENSCEGSIPTRRREFLTSFLVRVKKPAGYSIESCAGLLAGPSGAGAAGPAATGPAAAPDSNGTEIPLIEN